MDAEERSGAEPARERSEEWIAIGFEPGVVRTGRLLAREGASIFVDFPVNERHTLGVGATTSVRLGGSDDPTPQRAEVVEREDVGYHRRYRLLVLEEPGTSSTTRSAPRPAVVLARATRVELRFGAHAFEARLAALADDSLVLYVALEIESKLRAADALELFVVDSRGGAELRVAGWIERRTLEATLVRYDFRVDEQLTEDWPRERARLQALVRGETAPC